MDMKEKTLEERIEALEAELKTAKEEAAAKEKTAEPFKLKEPSWPRYDPTEGFRLPASAVRAMTEVVPDFRGIAAEQRLGRSVPGMLRSEPRGEPKVKGSGWVEPAPLKPPPGVAICDQIADKFADLDRIE